jgi:hypothetical protein
MKLVIQQMERWVGEIHAAVAEIKTEQAGSSGTLDRLLPTMNKIADQLTLTQEYLERAAEAGPPELKPVTEPRKPDGDTDPEPVRDGVAVDEGKGNETS